MRTDREPTMRRAAREGSAATPLSRRLAAICLARFWDARCSLRRLGCPRQASLQLRPRPGARGLHGDASSDRTEQLKRRPAEREARRRGSPAAISNSKPFPGYLTPERLHEAYALPTETAAGASQTIAVVDAFNDPTAEADLAVYDKQFGLAECTSENGCFRKVDQEGATSPLPKNEGGWATEISIDVQMARAICQDCHILLVETKSEEFTDLGAGVNAAAKAGATEISNSYGGTEQGAYGSLNSTYYNHPGIVVAASSGDCGYYNKLCPEDTVGANFPADSPDVVAVGGTSLTESSGVWASTVWQEGGSGCSTVFSAAAMAERSERLLGGGLRQRPGDRRRRGDRRPQHGRGRLRLDSGRTGRTDGLGRVGRDIGRGADRRPPSSPSRVVPSVSPTRPRRSTPTPLSHEALLRRHLRRQRHLRNEHDLQSDERLRRPDRRGQPDRPGGLRGGGHPAERLAADRHRGRRAGTDAERAPRRMDRLTDQLQLPMGTL